jgi:hypothetical protein
MGKTEMQRSVDELAAARRRRQTHPKSRWISRSELQALEAEEARKKRLRWRLVVGAVVLVASCVAHALGWMP